ncbi:hypothetical protein E2C01_081460 [Portunus trituberculatus]|uniref:Uncharacterized protein n=1 Tax=Portunus trituberculatus TaxID=210409 RepID=A0A5B7IVY2_PORTR|nr:hypothetical protein [Portunus trituberculatus]
MRCSLTPPNFAVHGPTKVSRGKQPTSILRSYPAVKVLVKTLSGYISLRQLNNSLRSRGRRGETAEAGSRKGARRWR